MLLRKKIEDEKTGKTIFRVLPNLKRSEDSSLVFQCFCCLSGIFATSMNCFIFPQNSLEARGQACHLWDSLEIPEIFLHALFRSEQKSKDPCLFRRYLSEEIQVKHLGLVKEDDTSPFVLMLFHYEINEIALRTRQFHDFFIKNLPNFLELSFQSL